MIPYTVYNPSRSSKKTESTHSLCGVGKLEQAPSHIRKQSSHSSSRPWSCAYQYWVLDGQMRSFTVSTAYLKTLSPHQQHLQSPPPPPPQQSAAWLSSWLIVSSHTPSFCPVTIVFRVVPDQLGQGHCEVCGHTEELWFTKWQPTWSGHVLRSALRGHLTKPMASLVCILAHCSDHLPSWSSGHFQSQ